MIKKWWTYQLLFLGLPLAFLVFGLAYLLGARDEVGR